MKRFRFSVGLDCDDVLFSCIPYAVTLANKDYNFDPPLEVDDIDGWLPMGDRSDVLLDYFKEPDFYKNQPVLEGAKEFVHKLCEVADVYVITAVPPECSSIRASRIMEEFPDIPTRNIFIGMDKEKVQVDFLLDDAADNILKSSAAYPVLMRKRWNEHVTGVLAVNAYADFLKILETVIKGYQEPRRRRNAPVVMTLVGPSGSGKTALSNILMKHENIQVPVSCTTREARPGEDERDYHFISREQFMQMKENGELLESTMYAGNGYGLTPNDVDSVLAQNKHVIMVLDICGAMAVKTRYPHAVTVFIKRNGYDRILSVLKRNVSDEEKTSRIVAMDREKLNEELCEYTVDNDGDLHIGAAEIEHIITSLSTIPLD